ncbi:MAG: SRPBCC family protein [Deltaproteobacteria bacterium]|nr:SRPBCC family protein [Deltaproteobacteria bacterium]
MYRRIALITLALFGILLGAAWMTPDTWYVEREVVVDAPAELIWEWVASPSRYPEWTAWNGEDDPSFSSEHFGGTGGYLSGYRWTSSESVGELLVTDSEPHWRVTLEGTLEKRFPVKGFIELNSLDEGGVEVRWSEAGELGWDPLMRLFRPLIEKHMKADFDQGLGRLKSLAEAEAAKRRDAQPHSDAPVGTFEPASPPPVPPTGG